MAIPAVNLSYIGKGPVASGETVAGNDSGPLSKKIVGFGQATLDGVATTFTINFIDGTKTPFGTWSGPAGNQSLTAAAPFAVFVTRVQGATDTAASSITAYASAYSTTGATVTLSATGSAGQLLSFLVEIYPVSTGA